MDKTTEFTVRVLDAGVKEKIVEVSGHVEGTPIPTRVRSRAKNPEELVTDIQKAIRRAFQRNRYGQDLLPEA